MIGLFIDSILCRIMIYFNLYEQIVVVKKRRKNDDFIVRRSQNLQKIPMNGEDDVETIKTASGKKGRFLKWDSKAST